MKRSKEQLINERIDGVLDESGALEFRRLCREDHQFAADAEQMQRLHRLIKADVPGDVDIRAEVLKRLERSPQGLRRDKNKPLLLRHFNVAAMFVMALLLGSVLWVILKPVSDADESPVLAAGDLENKAASPAAQTLRPQYSTFASSALSDQPQGLYNYNLTFETREIAKAERIFGQILYDKGLLDNTSVRRSGGRTVYDLQCGKKELAEISERLSALWAYSRDAKMDFCDYSRGMCFDIPAVSAKQAADILKTESVDEKIVKAKLASAINQLPQMPEAEIIPQIDDSADFLNIRPVLAGRKPDADKPKIQREIVLTLEFLLVD
jgi:hypothetical protein